MNEHQRSAPSRRTTAAAVLIVGTVCAVAIAVVTGSRTGAQVVALGSIRVGGPATETAPTHEKAGAHNGSARVDVYQAGIGRSQVPRVPVPRRIRIGAIGLDAPIIPVGVDGGTTEVPSDVGDVGWYRFGPTPGGPGSAVLLSHVDSSSQGPGAFFHLRELVPGDVISVAFEGSEDRRFEVVARRQYLKEHLPDAVFRRSGRPLLTLVTCGGTFDVSTLHYADNVVVYAVPTRAGDGS